MGVERIDSMRLSVHDLMTYKDGETPEEVYDRTRQFVQEIDKLNYTRYWFAEHHNTTYYASVSPELIATHMSALTDNLRLGTGGTMIMHYSPLKIVENVRTMDALAPGRADIGLGRAPGAGPNEILALAEGQSQTFDDLYDKVQVILDYLSDEKPERFYGRTEAAPKGLSHLPQPWMLGSSGQSATKTAELGLGYSFAKFFGIETDPEIFELYRNNFKPSVFFDKPEIIVSYMIIVADTEEEAFYHFKPVIMNLMSIRAGKMIPIHHPDQVKDYEFSQEEQAFVDRYLDKRFAVVGSKDQVKEILEDEVDKLGIDEIMAYSPIYDNEARVASYRKLAEIFDLV